MKKIKRILFSILAFSFLCFAITSHAQVAGGYPSLSDLNTELGKLQGNPLVTAIPYGTSAAGLPLTAYRLADGPDADKRKAIVVIGGIDGREAYTSSLCLAMMQQMLNAHGNGIDSVGKLLKTTAFLFIPVAFPDGAIWRQNGPVYETDCNAQPCDDDNDARSGEDGPDDLNGDGLITQIFYTHPAGAYLAHPDDPRIIVKADAGKGQKGQYHVLNEGIDNDKDQNWNEDGPGGTAFNRNFTYKYAWFSKGAGREPLDEPSARALVTFLFAQNQVHTVLALGPQDNLLKPWKYDANLSMKNGLVGEGDASCIARLGEAYTKTVYPKTKKMNTVWTGDAGGDLLSWAYFHYGRFALGGPGWYVPSSCTVADTALKADLDKRLGHENANIRRLAYLDLTREPDAYVPATPIKHPDFQDTYCAVSGIKPFAGLSPPKTALADSLGERHTAWLLQVAGQLPILGFSELKAEPLGNDVYKLTVKVHNGGLLPTHTNVGKQLVSTPLLVNELTLAKGQKLLSGFARTTFGPLAPGEERAFTYVVQGKGNVEIQAGSPQTGTVSSSLNLK